MPCPTFLFIINLTTNYISFIANLTIVGVGNRLWNAITYAPIFLNLGSYQTKLQRLIFWVNHQSTTNNCAWPFGILYLGVGMCGCQSLLPRLSSSSREGGIIDRYVIIIIIMLQLPHYISTAVDIILTIILAIHFVTIFSTGTIIMLMPPFPHYTTTGYTIPIHH